MAERRRLDSWKEIAAHFGRRVRTVQRWEKDEALPVHRHNHLQRGTVHAWLDELEAWQASRLAPPAPAAPPAAPPAPRTSRGPIALAALAVVLLGAALRGGGHSTPAPPAGDPGPVLTARYLLHRGKAAEVRRALELCEGALTLAPGSAALHECLAHGHLLLAREGSVPAREGFSQAKAEAERSLALDPSRTVARAVHGWTTYALDWKLPEAERELRASITASASAEPSAAALPHHGLANLLSSSGRHAEAIEELRRAQRLEPLSAALNDDGCWFFYRARRFSEALVEADRALTLEPDRPGARVCVIDAREGLGDLGGARDAAVALLRAVGDPKADAIGRLEGSAAVAAYRRRLLARLEERAAGGRAVPAMPLAMLHGVLGDSDDAVRWLEKGLRERDPVLLLVRVHPYFDAIRGDARVVALLARAGV